ncbi:MAG TPA: monofunctional biosynthetic peptidoglycan transglycosylase [Candidatus Binatia bacterium]|nr:monofunctional biosynthetic peptidoglycan transglycosylase [Candidatus Binatia bacterium]
MLRRTRTWIARLAAAFVVASLLGVLFYRVVDPPLTPLMVIRRFEGFGIDRQWVDLDAVSPALLRAVIASEDARFFLHGGIDFAAISDARKYNEKNAGKRRRGGSTITMQCARNVFLWQGRNYLRKGLEVWFAWLMELVWPKRRILEVYVNVVEWGPGIYGIEAAARHWFHVPAMKLNARQASLLAVMLPDPRRWNPAAPTGYLSSRARVIARRAGQVSLAGLGE